MNAQKIRETLPLMGKMLAVGGVLAFLYFYGSLIMDTLPASIMSSESLRTILPGFLNIAALIVATEVFLLITRFALSRYLENRGKKKEIKVILTLYTYLVWAFMGVLLLTTVFKDIGALLTSIGLIGFGITFALQKPIMNFVGWLTIVLTKPFNIGDRIEVNGIKGEVLSIQTMYTRVQGIRVGAQTKSDQIISVPNEFILTNPVTNFSRLGGLYTDDITVSVTYESNWRKASELLENVTEGAVRKFVKNNIPVTFAERRSWQEAVNLLQEASKRLRRGFVKQSVQEKIELLKTAESASEVEIQKPKIQMSLGESSIDLNVLFKTDITAVRDTKHEIAKNFMEAIERRDDIELAYPHMQIVYDEKPRRHSYRQERLFRQAEAEQQKQGQQPK